MTIPRSETLPLIILKSLQVVGLWREDKKYVKFLLARVAIFCYFSTYLTQLIALFMSKDDIERLFECFSVISFCGMGILKLYSLTRRSDIWLNILNQMTRLEHNQIKAEDLSIAEYESDEEYDEYVPSSMKKYTDTFKRTSTILGRIYCFTGCIFILSPFIEYGFAVLNGKNVEGYPHILPSWNPLDNIHFAFYVITIIFEVVAALYCVFVHITFDSTAIGIMKFICGQFSILVHNSTRIGGNGRNHSLSKYRDARAHYRIIICHNVHIQLVSTITELDRLLRNILGFYFFLATLTLCSVAVRLTSEQMSTMEIVSLLQYMGATLTQLYIYCSYGDAVYTQSTISQGEGPFGAAIWCISPKVRKDLTLLGFGMMKPRRLHAGPFNNVDLPSFIQIVAQHTVTTLCWGTVNKDDICVIFYYKDTKEM